MLTINIDYFTLKSGELPKTTILVDNGYHPQKIQKELEKIYPEIMTKIKFELSAQPFSCIYYCLYKYIYIIVSSRK